jgi:hypothetical protein
MLKQFSQCLEKFYTYFNEASCTCLMRSFVGKRWDVRLFLVQLMFCSTWIMFDNKKTDYVRLILISTSDMYKNRTLIVEQNIN